MLICFITICDITNNTVPLHKIGCISAIEARFIALALALFLHYDIEFRTYR